MNRAKEVVHFKGKVKSTQHFAESVKGHQTYCLTFKGDKLIIADRQFCFDSPSILEAINSVNMSELESFTVSIIETETLKHKYGFKTKELK
jgi:hypothetical protein